MWRGAGFTCESAPRVSGQTQLPRLNVFRSLNHIYAQVVDDSSGHTLVAASTRDKEVRKTLKSGGNVSAAKVVGQFWPSAPSPRPFVVWYSTGAAMPITVALKRWPTQLARRG